jgi:hypothetical protein
MSKLLVCILLLTASGFAQISAPRKGFVRDRAGALRPVLGVTGSFVLGEAIEHDIVSAGFGKTIGFAKKQNEIIRFRGSDIVDRTPAPEGNALFFMGNKGEVIEIYFPTASELWRVSETGYVVSRNASQPMAKIVEWLSDSLFAVRDSNALYAVRADAESEALQIPEAAQ